MYQFKNGVSIFDKSCYEISWIDLCHSMFSGSPVWARIGESKLEISEDETASPNHRIVEQIANPGYKYPLSYHDIALLRLESPVSFNDRIRPACLHAAPSTGTPEAIATGWGRVDCTVLHFYFDQSFIRSRRILSSSNWPRFFPDDSLQSNDLMKVTLPIVDQKSCNASYIQFGRTRRLPKGVVGEWTICAGATGRDTCQVNYKADEYVF